MFRSGPFQKIVMAGKFDPKILFGSGRGLIK